MCKLLLEKRNREKLIKSVTISLLDHRYKDNHGNPMANTCWERQGVELSVSELLPTRSLEGVYCSHLALRSLVTEWSQ